ncbi:hypothetical protein Acsp05_57660 [Actinokineospora sp. NBRC 105648]|nr:hypothetical protein Acsp05_57660 [Actinokineospora sp. NBRC 105648]
MAPTLPWREAMTRVAGWVRSIDPPVDGGWSPRAQVEVWGGPQVLMGSLATGKGWLGGPVGTGNGVLGGPVRTGPLWWYIGGGGENGSGTGWGWGGGCCW